MKTNVRLEDIMELLEEDEFIGKCKGAYSDGVVWYFGKLDNRGVLQGELAGKTLYELIIQVEQRKLEEGLRKAKLAGQVS